MLKPKEREQIKILIKNGFDLELISFEMDIPLEQVRKYKLDIENSTPKTTNTARNIRGKKNNNSVSKLSQIREKYNKLYFRSNKPLVNIPKKLTKQEKDEVTKVITTLEKTIEKLKTLPQKEKSKIATDMLLEFKKIAGLQLPLKEAEKIYELMSSSQLQKLKSKDEDKIDYYIKKQKGRCAKQYAEAIEYAQYDINDLSKLKELEQKINGIDEREKLISVGAVKTKISNKIASIKKEEIINRIRNDIPESIMSVVKDLASGSIDIQKANEIMDEEARKKVESKPKNKFTLTEEQEKKQMLIQIRKAIAEKTETVNIQNPEKTVLLIQELCGGGLVQSIGDVVKNLIAKNQFEQAKSLCDKFSIQSKESPTGDMKYIRVIKNEIRNAEIGNIVMKVITMNGTLEEERACFELLEKGLKQGNVNLSAISLGKSKDGAKNITLADIWTDELELEKDRR